MARMCILCFVYFTTIKKKGEKIKTKTLEAITLKAKKDGEKRENEKADKQKGRGGA